LGKALREMAALSPHPRGGEESLRRQVARWVNRQYVRIRPVNPFRSFLGESHGLYSAIRLSATWSVES
jgi:aspartate/methionine/tyrosine aminotransferase